MGHPFDVILQKVPVSSPHKKAWDERIQKYADDFPEAYVVDLPAAVRQIANRETMLDAVVSVSDEENLFKNSSNNPGGGGGGMEETLGEERGEKGGEGEREHGHGGEDGEGKSRWKVRAPRQIVAVAGTEEEVRRQVDAAGLQLPLLAKSLLADGSSDSHKVAIIHDADGLACVVRGDVPGLRPPCIVQEYVNHGGYLFKVYVVGDSVTMTRRKSLPDLRGARRSNRRRRENMAATRMGAAKSPAAANGGGDGGSSGKQRGDGGVGGGEHDRGGGGGGGAGGDDIDGTADVDGDVDDSGGESDGDDSGWYDATGLQSIPRVSCFKGGATDNETSWRDRVQKEDRHDGLKEIMEHMRRHGVDDEGEPTTSPLGGEASSRAGAGEGSSPTSDVHYLKHHRLSSYLAKNLTVSRIGSVDSIGGASGEDPTSASDPGGPNLSDDRGGGSGDGDDSSDQQQNNTGHDRRRRVTRSHSHSGPADDDNNTPRSSVRTAGLPPLAPGSALLRYQNGGGLGSGSFLSDPPASGDELSDTAGGGGLGGGGGVVADGIKVLQNMSPHFKPETPEQVQHPGRSGRGDSLLGYSKDSTEEGSNNNNNTGIAPPSDAFIRQLALSLRDKLRLRLFNFDLIRVNGKGDEFLVVDINYFPGIAKMPGYSDTFCNFLKSAKGKNGSQM